MNTPGASIRVELVFVHRSNEGETTYELQFVDATGQSSPQLVVEPFGKSRLKLPTPEPGFRLATDEDDQ